MKRPAFISTLMAIISNKLHSFELDSKSNFKQSVSITILKASTFASSSTNSFDTSTQI